MLFNHIIGLIDDFNTHEIPLADAFEVQLQLGEYVIDVELMWEAEKIAICDIINTDEKKLLIDLGWSVFDVDDCNAGKLSNMIRSSLNG